MKESVLVWNEAFERAGFKHAIDARLAPSAEEDSLYRMYDSRYPFISWKASGQRNAYGPTPCEPRAAEIVACHVGVFSSVFDLIRQWYFVQCGANDPRAWDIDYSDELMHEIMHFVITHEVGHSLGLEHNFFGSSLYSFEQ